MLRILFPEQVLGALFAYLVKSREQQDECSVTFRELNYMRNFIDDKLREANNTMVRLDRQEFDFTLAKHSSILEEFELTNDSGREVRGVRLRKSFLDEAEMDKEQAGDRLFSDFVLGTPKDLVEALNTSIEQFYMNKDEHMVTYD